MKMNFVAAVLLGKRLIIGTLVGCLALTVAFVLIFIKPQRNTAVFAMTRNGTVKTIMNL